MIRRRPVGFSRPGVSGTGTGVSGTGTTQTNTLETYVQSWLQSWPQLWLQSWPQSTEDKVLQKPNSRLQKYRLTAKGREILNKQLA